MLINEKKMLQAIKNRLSVNYIEGTDDVIVDLIKDLTSKASNTTNLKKDDERLIPYVKSAAIAEYNQRGVEGMLSRSEGGISSSFYDIVERMRNDLIKDGLRRFK